jgi:hypothetical protein
MNKEELTKFLRWAVEYYGLGTESEDEDCDGVLFGYHSKLEEWDIERLVNLYLERKENDYNRRNTKWMENNGS